MKGELRLERNISIYNGIGLIMGTCIGLGVYRTPRKLLEYANSTGLASTLAIFCSLMSIMGVYSFVELGTMIPKSGGEYTYTNITFGPFFGFLLFWTLTLASAMSQSMRVYELGKYLIIGFAELMDDHKLLVRDYSSDNYIDTDCENHELYKPGLIVAINIVLLVAFINCYSVDITRMIQDIFSFFSILSVMMVIIGNMIHLFKTDKWKGELTFQGTKISTASDFGKLGTGIFWGLFPYVGWHALNSIASEMKNPLRDLPKALLISIYALSLLYITLTISIYLIKPKEEILFNEVYMFQIAIEMYGKAAYPLIMVSIICNIFSSINGCMMVLSRMIVCAAEDGLLPHFYSMLQQKRKTPMPAVILNAFLLIFFQKH